jgi:hypothetical protein
MRKLHPLKYRGSRTEKTNYHTLQRPVPKHLKFSLYIALLLLEFKDDLYNFRRCSYSTLNRSKRMINKNVMRFENKRDENEENEKNRFCNSKKHNFFTAFSGWSFGFSFQR